MLSGRSGTPRRLDGGKLVTSGPVVCAVAATGGPDGQAGGFQVAETAAELDGPRLGDLGDGDGEIDGAIMDM